MKNTAVSENIHQSMPLLRLDELILDNFRCFSKYTVSLHPNLTVFVAENAQGKTAILEAIGIALDVFVTAIAADRKSRGFDRDSVRLSLIDGTKMEPSLPTEFHAKGYVDSSFVEWSRSLTKYDVRARSSTKDTKRICEVASRLRSRASSYAQSGSTPPPTLPITAFYGTGRLWSEHRFSEGKRVSPLPGLVRFSAYLDCMSSSSSFKTFLSWYENSFNDLRSPTSKVRGPEERLEKQLAAVQDAVSTVLKPTGWTGISWQFPPFNEKGIPQGAGFIVVEHPQRGRFPLALLSDGVKNMVALVADLAYRCVRLNSHLGESAAQLTPGIVLIDEVDMHLHPRWQQLVVELIQKAFPLMQMIMTTHSPLVLSTVDSKSIRIINLDDGKSTPHEPEYQTRGVESADILARLMGVDPVPLVEQSRWLSDYRAMVQLGEHECKSGLDLWSNIIDHFGADNPVLAEISTLRRLQEFKQTNGIFPKKDTDHA